MTERNYTCVHTRTLRDITTLERLCAHRVHTGFYMFSVVKHAVDEKKPFRPGPESTHRGSRHLRPIAWKRNLPKIHSLFTHAFFFFQRNSYPFGRRHGSGARRGIFSADQVAPTTLRSGRSGHTLSYHSDKISIPTFRPTQQKSCTSTQIIVENHVLVVDDLKRVFEVVQSRVHTVAFVGYRVVRRRSFRRTLL